MNKDVSAPNGEIIKIVDKFSENKYKALLESLYWIKNNLAQTDDETLFRKRDAGEIVKSGKYTGCTDVALVFLALMRALGVKATYMETVSKRTLADLAKYPDENVPITGHIFVRVFLEKTSVIVDPMNYQILLRNNLPAASMFPEVETIAEGKNFVALDLDNEEKIREKAKEFIRNFIRAGKN
jgi:hypothetical protein